MRITTADTNRLNTCVLLALLTLVITTTRLHAEGHGPAFGLATPTLGQGQWSSDTSFMALSRDDGTAFMFREMVGYGITEDLQGLLTFPLSPVIDPLKPPSRTRMGAMMGSMTDVEGSLLWRFHRQATDIGSRFESSLLLGGSVPTEEKRGGLHVGPALNAALVTGYASRTVYGWVGGGYQRYVESANDRLGDLPYATAVFGWRPPFFQRDYPKPDWRIFVESLAEFPQRNRSDGARLANSGGERMLVGPSVLGLYGKWGVEAGVLFPVHQRLNGNQPEEKFRAKVVFTWWF